MSSKQFSLLSKSSKSVEYGTPLDFFQKLNNIFNFESDPCTTEANPLKLSHIYTEKDNGLIHSWPHNTYINPPFGRNIIQWIEKMKYEHMNHPDKVYVMLLPARTDTVWFQQYVMDYNVDGIIYFIRGRLKFVNPDLNSKSEPHIIGSMLWILPMANVTFEQLSELQRVIPGIYFSNRMTCTRVIDDA
jgi:phage N-6-adenine-methyltransferase